MVTRSQIKAEKGKQISRTQWLIQTARYQSESCGRSLKFHPLQQLYVHIRLMREPTRFVSTCKDIETPCWKERHPTAAITYSVSKEKKRESMITQAHITTFINNYNYAQYLFEHILNYGTLSALRHCNN